MTLSRCRMCRRSVSSLVSPGPRVPMPPPRRDSQSPEPTSRGIRYFSCASSTCSWPSRVRARRAKMSRISCVRSRTRELRLLLEIAQLRRAQLVVDDDEVDVQLGARLRRACRPCRARGRAPGSGAGRSCTRRRTTSAPAARASPSSSSRLCSAAARVTTPVASPTSAARCRPRSPWRPAVALSHEHVGADRAAGIGHLSQRF